MVDIKDFNVSISTNVAMFFLSFVAPGFLIVFLLSPQLFNDMDFWKLFIFSSSITVPPFAFALMFAASAYFNIVRDYPDRPDYAVSWGGPREWYLRLGFNNSISMYVNALLIWTFDFGVKGFVICGVITTVLNIVSEIYLYLRFTRNPEGSKHLWLSSLNALLK
jgi:hypothetical protein